MAKCMDMLITDPQTDETCELKVRCLSNVTPSVVSVSETEMNLPALSTEATGTRDPDHCTVVSQIASDLSGFRERSLRQNQQWRAERQRPICSVSVVTAVEVIEIKNCVSCAYCR